MTATRRTAFEISSEWEAIVAAIEDADGEVTPDVEARIAALEGETADKLEAIACVVTSLEGEADTLKATAKRFNDRAAVKVRAVEFVRGLARRLLEASGSRKLVTPSGWQWSIQTNGGKLPVVMMDGIDVRTLPEMFVRIERTPNRDAIREALEMGSVLDFALLGPRGESVRLK